MKKIMFKDEYGLTEAVILRLKTMTRRTIPLMDTDKEYLDAAFNPDLHKSVIINRYARYKVGEEVAVAQRYADIVNQLPDRYKEYVIGHYSGLNAWTNKMFVRADLMPHSIRITDIKVERLQDISDNDCLKEGIYRYNATPNALGMDRYEFISYAYDTRLGEHIKRWWYHNPREAFAALIDKVSGKGTWESNPWMFAYSFELVI